MRKLVARVAHVKEEIDAGQIHLPEPGEGCVWSLFDSGSAINAANHKAHFPGATVEKDDRPNTYHSATGEAFQSKGKFEVPFLSENRHRRRTVYLDAPVAMPITSSNAWACDGFRSTLDEDWGDTVQKLTGETDPLIVRNGTYFMKMRVSSNLLPKQKPKHGFQEACAP